MEPLKYKNCIIEEAGKIIIFENGEEGNTGNKLETNDMQPIYRVYHVGLDVALFAISLQQAQGMATLMQNQYVMDVKDLFNKSEGSQTIH